MSAIFNHAVRYYNLQDNPCKKAGSMGICGTFFLAGLGAEDFISLTEEQLRKFSALYDNIVVLAVEKPPAQERPVEQRKKRETHHER